MTKVNHWELHEVGIGSSDPKQVAKIKHSFSSTATVITQWLECIPFKNNWLYEQSISQQWKHQGFWVSFSNLPNFVVVPCCLNNLFLKHPHFSALPLVPLCERLYTWMPSVPGCCSSLTVLVCAVFWPRPSCQVKLLPPARRGSW